MTEKIGYKYSIKFNQSLTSGTIAFEGYYAFDEAKDFEKKVLVELMKAQEKAFQDEGYKIASKIEPKEKKETSK